MITARQERARLGKRASLVGSVGDKIAEAVNIASVLAALVGREEELALRKFRPRLFRTWLFLEPTSGLVKIARPFAQLPIIGITYLGGLKRGIEARGEGVASN